MSMQSLRGMKDLLADEARYYDQVIKTARKFANVYNFEHLITPCLEMSEVFHRSIGETSDIVSKETYSFMDRDKSPVTLRPEFTAGIVRALISNGLTQSLPKKFFSYGPVFRHERPQKARYRQFNQINFEYFGAKDYVTDVEVIALANDILKQLKILGYTNLNINTLGDATSRAAYREKLYNYLAKYKNELSSDSQNRLEKNPLRILDSKDENDRRILQDAPDIMAALTTEARQYFDNVLAGLEELNIDYNISKTLVRGLDYYSHTIFEFITQELGSQGTVLAGGRYDGLVEFMGGPQIPAIGFAAGVERLSELMKEVAPLNFKRKLIYIVPIGDGLQNHALSLTQNLRAKGYTADYDCNGNLAKRMKRADKFAARFVVLFGEDEIKAAAIKFRDMDTGEELTLKEKDLLSYLKRHSNLL
jgi:histidyl-tRNA synthetase